MSMHTEVITQELYARRRNRRVYSQNIEILGLPKRINQRRGVHWSVIKKEADLWHKLVAAHFATKKPHKALEKARLTLIRCSSKCPDYDGLVISFKHVIDALVKIGVIQDDSMSNIGMPTFLWKKVSAKEGKIIIYVSEEI